MNRKIDTFSLYDMKGEYEAYYTNLSREEYTLRLHLNTQSNYRNQMKLEEQTDKLYSQTILSFTGPPRSCNGRSQIGYEVEDWGSRPNACVEDRYQGFVVLQTLVDHALLWGQNISVAGPRNSLLPTSDEELCSAQLVRFTQYNC